MMLIRELTPEDHAAVAAILHAAFSTRDTYAVPDDMTPQEALAYWTAPDNTVYVTEAEGHILGTYFLRPNAQGPGAHICNCGYVTAASARGRGVASAMQAHSLGVARRAGYRAMQFNAVVSTNEVAVRLWQKAGFATIGRVPGAFHHPSLGYVDTLIMYMPLVDDPHA